MKNKFHRCFLVLFAWLALAPGALRAEGEDEWPPRQNGFNLVARLGLRQLGPEGALVGLGYALWDLGEEDRNLYMLAVFADTPYRTYLLDYTEPGLIKDGDRLRLTAYYQLRPATHFFGIGPDREMEDGAYYQREDYLYALSYDLPLADYFGVSVGLGYDRAVCRESEIDAEDRDGFLHDFSELDRPVEEVYPGLPDSRAFKDEFNHYWFLSVWLDNREGPANFPTRGGLLEAAVKRVDPALAADFSFWQYTVGAEIFLPLTDNYNILSARARWDRMDGDYIPFHALPALGTSRSLTAFVTDDNAMRGVWENMYADRNRFLATIEYRHRVKADWYPDPEGEDAKPSRFKGFLQRKAWLLWVDAGQVWPDDETLNDLRYSYGGGLVMYLKNGMSNQITLGFSEDLNYYLLMTFDMPF